MNHDNNLYNKFSEFIEENNIFINEPMKNHTSFKVGGPADILVTPENYEQVQKAIKLCIESNIDFYIIGNGSNLLVKDGGIRGVVIKLTKLNDITVEGEKIIVQSGAELKDVSQRAVEESLTGIEFACGIPGSVGGAVTMNAGAYGGEICHIIESALILDENCEMRTLDYHELELGYRVSAIQKYKYTVLLAIFKLQTGNHYDIEKRVNDLNKRRRDRQPLEYPSAGSTFKRPEGYFTGKLVEDSGLKGVSMGGAQVSSKHSGFIINKGGATAKDILDLIAYVQKTVKEKFNVELQTEVRIIGE
ncbi:MAG: murB [Clostridiaceae bacterium]|jgi:UDP-N-acetylmuramate dehydrogenase|nr:murB [Clostridiaceae bacterium]